MEKGCKLLTDIRHCKAFPKCAFRKKCTDKKKCEEGIL